MKLSTMARVSFVFGLMTLGSDVWLLLTEGFNLNRHIPFWFPVIFMVVIPLGLRWFDRATSETTRAETGDSAAE